MSRGLWGHYIFNCRGKRWQTDLVLKIRIESPFATGWVVIITGWLPEVGRVFAGEHGRDGTIIPERNGTAPTFQQTGKILITDVTSLFRAI